MGRILFTSKDGGVSAGDYYSNNLGLHVGDDPEIVMRNRKLLVDEFSLENIVFMEQTHSTTVVEIFEPFNSLTNSVEADAIITTQRNVGLAVQVADCIPLLLYSPQVVAAVHVGRRGLLNGIIEKVLEHITHYCDPKDLVAEIGPAICSECYEVDQETYMAAIEKIPECATSENELRLDLVAGSSALLSRGGVHVRNWHVCTRCDEGYFSYRKNPVTGRQVGVVAL
ncbi:MAG: peptidoglycan editing factor PgeF [Actinomycetes bacterium]